ncbi:hypothetical protein AB1282_15145 [Gottfriedia sp. S16(2024)]|uniref:hypothetical protein n=1 Tax=Gottfriedia sp. S16(2024) TaxID=3162883 RepID=UPI003D1AE694
MLPSKSLFINFLLSISFVIVFLVTTYIMNDTLRSSNFAVALGGGAALFLYCTFKKNTSSKQ